jgi:hypothetical protein
VRLKGNVHSYENENKSLLSATKMNQEPGRRISCSEKTQSASPIANAHNGPLQSLRGTQGNITQPPKRKKSSIFQYEFSTDLYNTFLFFIFINYFLEHTSTTVVTIHLRVLKQLARGIISKLKRLRIKYEGGHCSFML